MVTPRVQSLHVRTLRYSDRGGLTRNARAAREALRFATAERFERGDDVGEIARELSVRRKSVNEWKRARRAGDAEALASKSPDGATCRLDEVQLKTLNQALEEGRGPALDAGRGDMADHRVVPRAVHPARGVLPAAPHRLESAGAAARRSRARRGQGRHLGEGDAAAGKSTTARLKAWILFEDEAGQSLRPLKARTWLRCGHTPKVLASGRGSGRSTWPG
jgi:transposase-like protein